jgi:hypothetical protein
MQEIERANPDTLYRVFGTADWGNKETFTVELLKDLIEGFSSTPWATRRSSGSRRTSSTAPSSRCVVTLRRSKPAERGKKVLIIDASILFRKGRAQNFLDPGHTGQILSWYRAFADIDDRAKMVSLDEVRKEGWTLNISSYVLPPIGEDIPPLPQAVEAFRTGLAEARAAEDRPRTVLTEGGWPDCRLAADRHCFQCRSCSVNRRA